MATAWKYKRRRDLDNVQMNNLGAEGWELVNIFAERVNEFETVVGGIQCSVRAGELEFGELAAR